MIFIINFPCHRRRWQMVPARAWADACEEIRTRERKFARPRVTLASEIFARWARRSTRFRAREYQKFQFLKLLHAKRGNSTLDGPKAS